MIQSHRDACISDTAVPHNSRWLEVSHRWRDRILWPLAAVLIVAAIPFRDAIATEPTQGDPAEGYRLLTEKAYLPADFDQEVFDQLWQTWPEPLRSQAEQASVKQRRAMTRARYGLTTRPGTADDRPLQYVVSASGEWSMNCFACHGGSVYGSPHAGSPNSQFALEMLTRDVRATKIQQGKPLTHMDVGSLFMPLGKTRGTTNAVMFGVALLAYRDAELNLLPKRLPPSMTHHDMDAPPWWHFHKKSRLYVDNFAPKSHRALMQFMLVEQNGPEEFRAWDEEFRHVNAYLESLRAPAYPFAIDRQLAENGREIFEATCAECHGTYDVDGDTYPERIVPWEQLRTDRVRLDSLTMAHREKYQQSWFAEDHRDQVVTNPEGYVAPPLDGVWASAPYFHNGSVPTLWHVLHPEKRPRVWRRSADLIGKNGDVQPDRSPDWEAPFAAFDRTRVGLRVSEMEEIPKGIAAAQEMWEYFDTRDFGKSASGHDFPATLTREERVALLEYLKTL